MTSGSTLALCGLFLAGVLGSVPAAAAVEDSARAVLPAEVYPEHYDLAIVPDAARLTFAGTVRIDLRVLRTVRTITLNAVDLELDRARLDGQGGAPRITRDPVARRRQAPLLGAHSDSDRERESPRVLDRA